MKSITVTKTVDVVGSYDVVVLGAGPAGVFAAIAAAREGAKVALVERFGFLGGMATAGLVMPLSVFTYQNKRVIGGIPWQFLERLEAMGGGYIEKPLGNVAFDPELYKLCMQRMVLEAGVELYMNSYLTGAQVANNGAIECVVIENKNGSEALESKVFIDCTGDADLAAMAGVEMQPMNGEPLQPLSTYFILAGVDTSSPIVFEAMHHNKQGENCHCLPIRNYLIDNAERLNIPEFGGPWFCTTLHEGCVGVNMTRTAADACDNRDYTAAECRLREDVYRMAAILRENFAEFKDCYVASVATQAGIRETRRIKGVHTMTAEEYMSGYKYEDSISRGAHPIDIHATKGSSQVTHFLEQAAYVPYRALIAENFPNLLVAGRCISADRKAFASMRVQASCMGTGQAAGVAAAMAAKGSCAVQDVDTAALVARLKDIGAELE
ncbi:MAG: FAD-dependent oxidoreductase [Alistipes sp.]|nr:FAD-dependent oxidoreductase [Alistipes sp.]